ncbi:MAG TPA: hypothetical protein VJ476_07850 [Rhizomicrobium sp.]|nr:hypothetical protein [Rhizomicrobium sp.]
MRFVLPSVVLAAGLLLSVAGASAQSQPTVSPASPAVAPAGSATTPAPSDVDNGDVVTCRYEKTTGSLFAKRICHTQREWKQMQTDAKDMLNNLDNGRAVNLGG